jgi:ubiquinone biosynthesis protein UbiJ
MSNEKPSSGMKTPELEALASEAADMWQDYFATLAGQSAAKADLIHLLEPQRRLFADFIAMMQHGRNGPAANSRPASPAPHAAPSRAAAAPLTFDDGALRVAQLAHRVAELEKRLTRLEARAAGTAKTPRPRGK